MPDWQLVESGATVLTEAAQELAAERELRQLLEESYADLEALYREDVGWRKLGEEQAQFSLTGRKQIAALADLMATGNALIKRGLNLRIAYVWGQGVTVTIRDDGAEGQDVNAVWQAFWDEVTNRAELTSSEAQARLERRLGTSGEAFYAFPTDPITGRVRARRIPPAEIVDRICDPEDAATVWWYKRSWNAVTFDQQTGEKRTEHRTTLYPALGYRPPEADSRQRPDRLYGATVAWDAPMRHIAVNVPDKDWRGIGDVLPALPWARMDKEFLEDLAVYMRALTRILGHVTGKSGRAATAAAKIASGAAATPGNPNGVAGWAVTDPNTTLSLVSKSGAQIDAESHRPFATMVAAAIEVPLTMLLGDPGVTGARATAETLDQPTELMAKLRREVHAEFYRDVAGYVIDQAAIAPRGPLTGNITRDGDRVIVTLPEGDERTVQIDWPEFSSVSVLDQVKAIQVADQTEKMPPLQTFLLLAQALGIDDVDDLVDQLTDDDGNWIPLDVIDAQVRARLADRGDDGTSFTAPDDELDDPAGDAD